MDFCLRLLVKSDPRLLSVVRHTIRQFAANVASLVKKLNPPADAGGAT